MIRQVSTEKADLLQLLLHTASYTCPSSAFAQTDNNLPTLLSLDILHAHLVDVHGGTGPAQAPELGDHGGGLGGGGHGGGTRPSGQPLVTALVDSPGCCCWSVGGTRRWDRGSHGSHRGSSRLPLLPLSLPHPHTTQSMGGAQ